MQYNEEPLSKAGRECQKELINRRRLRRKGKYGFLSRMATRGGG
jgi:hypothetical protein